MSILVFEKGEIGHWLPEGPDVQGSINLDKLSDVTITSVQDGQSLQYDLSQGQWVNRDIAANSIDGGTY